MPISISTTTFCIPMDFSVRKSLSLNDVKHLTFVDREGRVGVVTSSNACDFLGESIIYSRFCRPLSSLNNQLIMSGTHFRSSTLCIFSCGQKLTWFICSLNFASNHALLYLLLEITERNLNVPAANRSDVYNSRDPVVVGMDR